jgi:site-specific DNA-cytosine methylase
MASTPDMISLRSNPAQPVIGFDLAQITSKLNYSNPKSGDPQPPLNLAAQGMVAYDMTHAQDAIRESGNIVNTLQQRMGTGGNNVPIVANILAGGSSKAHSDITSGQQDGNVIPVQTGVRRLTPTECERLQGFPDNWTAGQSDSTRYKQLGNAVCVPVAEWIGKRILEISNG